MCREEEELQGLGGRDTRIRYVAIWWGYGGDISGAGLTTQGLTWGTLMLGLPPSDFTLWVPAWS